MKIVTKRCDNCGAFVNTVPCDKVLCLHCIMAAVLCSTDTQQDRDTQEWLTDSLNAAQQTTFAELRKEGKEPFIFVFSYMYWKDGRGMISGNAMTEDTARVLTALDEQEGRFGSPTDDADNPTALWPPPPGAREHYEAQLKAQRTLN